MEATRYRNRRVKQKELNVTRTNVLPVVAIITGISVTVIGAILFAAFGLPKNISSRPERVSGPIVLSIGIIITMIAAGMAIKAKQRDRVKSIT